MLNKKDAPEGHQRKTFQEGSQRRSSSEGGARGYQKDKQQNPTKELLRRTVSVSRVSKVAKGGKNFSFSALCVVGDGKGRVGYGLGKAKEVADAIKKGQEIASRSMEKFPLKEGRTTYQDVRAHFGAAQVIIRSAQKGSGIIAGGAMRSIFEVAGIHDVVAKNLGSNNPHNVVKATIKGLGSIRSPRMVAIARGKKVQDLFASI